MKKIFTLIAMAAMTLAASAQTLNWQVTSSTSLAAGDKLVDNGYATATAALNSSEVAATQFADEDGNPTPKTINSVTFKYYVPTRVTDLPAAANNYQGTEAEGSIAVNIVAKQNTDVQIYARIGSTKTITLYDATEKANVATKNSFEVTDYDNVLVVAVGQLQKDHNYVLCMRGGTMGLCALNFVEGTYVAPSSTIYQNATAATVEGFSTITYGDGAKLVLNNSAKAWSSGSSITIDGSKYTSIKVSNGAQNTFVAPEGKYVTSVKIWSYVNKDAATERPCFWKEVNGVQYSLDGAEGTVQTTVMECYKGTNFDSYTYDLGGVSSFTFTNTGEQACFVLDVTYGEASGINNVTSAAAAKVVKTIENGQLVIKNAKGTFNVAGAQVK